MNEMYNYYKGKFTIHFATINTIKIDISTCNSCSFTIHFATINTFQTNLLEDVFLHLQYTLLLLIPLIKISAPEISKFTIHFATINTYFQKVLDF